MDTIQIQWHARWRNDLDSCRSRSLKNSSAQPLFPTGGTWPMKHWNLSIYASRYEALRDGRLAVGAHGRLMSHKVQVTFK